MVGKAPGGIKHLGIAGQLTVGDRHLEEMAGIVQRMIQTQVLPSLVLVLDDEIGNEETVFLLGGENAVDDVVDALAQ